MRAAIVRILLLLALPAAAAPGQATPKGIEAGYRTIAQAIEAKRVGDLAGAVAESFEYVPFEGGATDRAHWLATWARNFADVEAYAAASYQVRWVVAQTGTCVVVVERTIFFRVPGARRESVQVCRTQDEWAERDGRWLLRSQRELGFPDDGEVVPIEPPESARLRRLRDELKTAGATAIDDLIDELRGRGPLVEKIDSDATRRLVTFLYRGEPSVQSVVMAGGPYRDGPKTLSRLEGTNLWYRTERIPSDSKFVYFFTVTQPRPKLQADGRVGEPVIVTLPSNDPLNPIEFNGGSVVWPADVPSPIPSTQPQTKLRGKHHEHTLKSGALGEDRSFSVYTPPADDKAACLLVALDGEDYTGLIPTPAILDGLIAAGRLPPTVGVFVMHQGLRFRDLRCSAAFSRFLATELVPWLRANYGTTDRPDRTVIAGASLGGLAAAYASDMHPQVFGKVLSQSGAFWYHPEPGQDGWLATRFAATDRRPTEFWMEVGAFESTAMVSNNRRFRDVLRAKGYPVRYREYNGGHDFLTWRESLATGLVDLLNEGDEPGR